VVPLPNLYTLMDRTGVRWPLTVTGQLQIVFLARYQLSLAYNTNGESHGQADHVKKQHY
jgi:hypothetical protein